MPSKYEIAAKETVPIARSLLARELVENYHMKETAVAEMMGVAQAAVSKYVSEKCSQNLKNKTIDLEEKMRPNKNQMEGYVQKIAEGKREYVKICICTMCTVVNNFACPFSSAKPLNGA